MSNASRPDDPSPRLVHAPLRVALLEDDDVLRDRVLLPGLQRHGFDVIALRTIQTLHALLRNASVELIVLDIGLPDGDGFALTQQLQAMHPALGIVILSGRGDQPDRLRGLSQGADAYLVKPVEIEMLAATLFSVARRLPRGPANAPTAPTAAAHDAWQLQDDGWCLFAPDGNAVPLTGSERLVLHCLWQSAGRLVSRRALLTTLGGSLGMEIDPHRLEALLHRLRHKVLARSGAALPLTSVRGAGYLLMLDQRQAHDELRACAGHTVRTQHAAGLQYQFVRHGQAQTGTLAGRLGGEERRKDLRHHIGRHAVTGIDQGNADHRALPRHVHAEIAAIGHRIACIGGDVEHDQIELTAVQIDRHRRCAELQLQLHVRAAQLRQHRGDRLHCLRRIEVCWHRQIASAETQ